jgi:hypothetical protein
MSIQAVNSVPTIQWDDSGVFIFSFDANGSTFFAGFIHVQIQLAIASGSTVQVTAILQQATQVGVQFASDPQSWIETIKNASRASNPIAITFDDALSVVYTTQTNQSFTLQQLFSVAG